MVGFQFVSLYRCLKYANKSIYRSCDINALRVTLNSRRLNSSMVNQHFDYFLVLDFEATCDKNTVLVPQEIIEFPCLKVNGRTLEIEETFHQYVKPRVHTQLTDFCTELTGIIQEMVEDEPDIEMTLQKFDDWMKQQGLLDGKRTFTFVTCGDWDLNVMLPQQCRHFNLVIPCYMKAWINLKKSFAGVTGIWPRSLPDMVSHFHLPFAGRLHSGIDDCINIAKVVKALAEKSYVFNITGRLQ